MLRISSLEQGTPASHGNMQSHATRTSGFLDPILRVQLQPEGMTEEQLLEAAIQESMKQSAVAPPPPAPPPASGAAVAAAAGGSEDVPIVYDEAASIKLAKPDPEDIVYDEAQLQEVTHAILVVQFVFPTFFST